ncbi:hypothetical protein LCGC14_1674530, partial [marine sediment metagenome]
TKNEPHNVMMNQTRINRAKVHQGIGLKKATIAKTKTKRIAMGLISLRLNICEVR